MVDNFLPNCQWQLWSGLGYKTKRSETGTQDQAIISASSFSVTNNSPIVSTANSQEVKPGDLVRLGGNGYYWRYSGVPVASPDTSVRVQQVNPGSIVIGPCPLGGVTPASSYAIQVQPISPGENGQGAINNADGWRKDGTVTVWPDDFASNSCPGAIRTLGMCKGVAASEVGAYWVCAPNQLKRYLGRTITFGVLVKQRVQAGAGTWKLYVSNGSTRYATSVAGTGVSYHDPVYGAFEFVSVTTRVDPASSTVVLGIELDGAVGDVYYAAMPTADFVSSMVANDCGQNAMEEINSINHWNPPLLTPMSMTFPSTPIPGTVLYGYTGQDIEALSHGVVHNSVASLHLKMEYTTPTVGATFLTGSAIDDYSLDFGPEVTTQVANVRNCAEGWMSLHPDGTCAFVVDRPGVVVSNNTFDFDSVKLSMPAYFRS